MIDTTEKIRELKTETDKLLSKFHERSRRARTIIDMMKIYEDRKIIGQKIAYQYGLYDAISVFCERRTDNMNKELIINGAEIQKIIIVKKRKM